MRWQGREGSGNVEDRRGMGVGLPVGGGIGGLVLVLLFSALTGRNPIDLINSSTDDTTGTTGVQEDDPQSRFASVVLKDTEDVWMPMFADRNARYEPPTLVLFTDATRSSCGLGESAMGPFYCPSDQKIYLDLSFFRDLDQRFGAPGDFAQAYVIAHEVGHHVQTQLGLPRGDSVSIELQADCLAGVWGHYAAQRGLLEPGDAEEGLQAAAAIGDDRIQRQTQGYVVPESFTHGSSDQRVFWLRRGLESGRIDSCDTTNRRS